MSRGPGRVQVAVMDALRHDYDEHGRPELWLCITTVDLGLHEHRESRRRAAHQLAQAGLIELCRATREVSAASTRFHSTRVARSLLFARLPYGASHLEHTLELRAEYEMRLGVFLDPNAEERDRIEARRWVSWYEEPERRLIDLGDDIELIAVKGAAPTSAMQRLVRRSSE